MLTRAATRGKHTEDLRISWGQWGRGGPRRSGCDSKWMSPDDASGGLRTNDGTAKWEHSRKSEDEVQMDPGYLGGVSLGAFAYA